VLPRTVCTSLGSSSVMTPANRAIARVQDRSLQVNRGPGVPHGMRAADGKSYLTVGIAADSMERHGRLAQSVEAYGSYRSGHGRSPEVGNERQAAAGSVLATAFASSCRGAV
jgi:hypothetical protein